MTDKYVNSNVEAGKIGNAALVNGARVIAMVTTFEVAADDADGDVYRLFKGLDSSLIPLECEILNDAITGGTDWDLGLYQTEDGAVADKDCLIDGMNMSGARPLTSGSVGYKGMPAIDHANIGKKLYELLGKTAANKAPRYDVALTANTVGTAAGTISVKMSFLQG